MTFCIVISKGYSIKQDLILRRLKGYVGTYAGTYVGTLAGGVVWEEYEMSRFVGKITNK